MLQNTGDEGAGVASQAAHDGGLAARGPNASTPSRGASSSAAPWCSGSATASASSVPRPTSSPWPPPSPTTAASTSCRPSRASVPRTGTRTLAAPSWASPAAPRRATWRGPPSKAIAYQVADLARRDARPTPACRLPELRVDGGAARQRPPDAVPGRHPGRPGRPARGHRDDGPRRGLSRRAWRWASGRRPAEISGQWQVERRFEPGMAKAKADGLRERWKGALERSKGWEPAE